MWEVVLRGHNFWDDPAVRAVTGPLETVPELQGHC